VRGNANTPHQHVSRLTSLPSPFLSVHDLHERSGISLATLERLAAADAFRSLGLDRRQALWAVKALAPGGPLPLFAWAQTRDTGSDAAVMLPAMPLSEHVVNDYQTLRLSLKAHPVSFLRGRLDGLRAHSCAQLKGLKDGTRVKVGGVVLVRQRPGSANGVVFMTLEDETDIANIIIWPKVFARNRRVVMTSRFVAVRGRLQRAGLVVHVLAESFIDLSSELVRLRDLLAPAMPPGPNPQPDLSLLKSRDFH
jgi:error-prone DNA polymerase